MDLFSFSLLSVNMSGAAPSVSQELTPSLKSKLPGRPGTSGAEMVKEGKFHRSVPDTQQLANIRPEVWSLADKLIGADLSVVNTVARNLRAHSKRLVVTAVQVNGVEALEEYQKTGNEGALKRFNQVGEVLSAWHLQHDKLSKSFVAETSRDPNSINLGHLKDVATAHSFGSGTKEPFGISVESRITIDGESYAGRDIPVLTKQLQSERGATQQGYEQHVGEIVSQIGQTRFNDQGQVGYQGSAIAKLVKQINRKESLVSPKQISIAASEGEGVVYSLNAGQEDTYYKQTEKKGKFEAVKVDPAAVYVSARANHVGEWHLSHSESLQRNQQPSLGLHGSLRPEPQSDGLTKLPKVPSEYNEEASSIDTLA